MEIPKLEVIECDYINNGVNGEYIDLDNLKEVIAFWNKYKDNFTDFIRDFPQYLKPNKIDCVKWNMEGIIFYCKINDIDYNDWLFNELFNDIK